MKLAEALAGQKLLVRNKTSGEVSVHYPKLNERGEWQIANQVVGPFQLVDLTSLIPMTSLRRSPNLVSLVNNGHLDVVAG